MVPSPGDHTVPAKGVRYQLRVTIRYHLKVTLRYQLRGVSRIDKYFLHCKTCPRAGMRKMANIHDLHAGGGPRAMACMRGLGGTEAGLHANRQTMLLPRARGPCYSHCCWSRQAMLLPRGPCYSHCCWSRQAIIQTLLLEQAGHGTASCIPTAVPIRAGWAAWVSGLAGWEVNGGRGSWGPGVMRRRGGDGGDGGERVSRAMGGGSRSPGRWCGRRSVCGVLGRRPPCVRRG